MHLVHVIVFLASAALMLLAGMFTSANGADEKNPPAVERKQSDNHVEAGGFSRAVGTEQSDDLPA